MEEEQMGKIIKKETQNYFKVFAFMIDQAIMLNSIFIMKAIMVMLIFLFMFFIITKNSIQINY